MSFADPRSSRAQRAPDESPSVNASRRPPGSSPIARRRTAAGAGNEAETVERPRGSSYRRSVDWERVGLVGAGLLVGALLGAGTALLLAPQSGRDTRVAIGRRAQSARHRAADAWDDFADELSTAARRRRRQARRALTRAKWRASDAIA